ncbi:hypothetical protein HK097_010455 [Rhizophlyctis rosea]|uniref:Uncharacterized protein n=1 Tax=Rhizophlyctis rosea TaxID=64517 RepID=A0AAD5X2J0_9FUNG|nr:hypothetical protein HK097_010455 [Rhizophlyctis rosea]
MAIDPTPHHILLTLKFSPTLYLIQFSVTSSPSSPSACQESTQIMESRKAAGYCSKFLTILRSQMAWNSMEDTFAFRTGDVLEGTEVETGYSGGGTDRTRSPTAEDVGDVRAEHCAKGGYATFDEVLEWFLNAGDSAGTHGDDTGDEDTPNDIKMRERGWEGGYTAPEEFKRMNLGNMW